MKPEEFIEIVEDKISDIPLREFIFGGELTKTKVVRDNLILACNNVLRLAFGMVYERFERLQTMPDCKNNPNFENARVSEALYATYFSEDASLEMVAYVLTEILVNKSEDDKWLYKLLLRDVDNNTRKPYDPALFSDLLKIIKNFEAFSGDENISTGDMMQKFLTLLSIMRFFMHGKLIVGEDNFVSINFFNLETEDSCEYRLSFKLADQEIPLLEYCDEYDEYYYLLSVSETSQKIFLNFVNLKNYNIVRCQEILKPAQTVIAKQREVSFLRRLFTESYSNLKESAFIIIDAIERDTNILRRIKDTFGKDSPCQDFFSSCQRETESEDIFDRYNWDNLITMLLAHCGPSDFLDTILDNETTADDTLFKRILQKIELRYKKIGQTKEEMQKQAQQDLKIQNERIPSHLPDEERRIYEKENAIFTYRRTIISALRNLLSDRPEGKVKYNKGFRFSAQVRYKVICGMIEEMQSGRCAKPVSVFLESLKTDLRETLKFLIMFYSGLIEYGKKAHDEETKQRKNIDVPVQFAHKTAPRIAADLRVRAIVYEAELVEAFCLKAKEALSGIKKHSLSELNNDFVELCKSLEINSVRTEESRALYKIINRYRILNLEEYNLVTEIPKDTMSADFPKDVDNIFDFFDKSGYHEYSKEDAIRVAQRIKYFYVYLVFAGDYKNDGIIPSEKDVDPIFPYYIKYDSKIIDKDKYNKNKFLIRTSMGDITGGSVISGSRGYNYETIRILTDKDYDEHEHFYALPRREGSTPHWWITPFMIPCSSVNAIMSEDNEEEENAAFDA